MNVTVFNSTEILKQIEYYISNFVLFLSFTPFLCLFICKVQHLRQKEWKKDSEKSVNTNADVWIYQILSLNDTCNIQMVGNCVLIEWREYEKNWSGFLHVQEKNCWHHHQIRCDWFYMSQNGCIAKWRG